MSLGEALVLEPPVTGRHHALRRPTSHTQQLSIPEGKRRTPIWLATYSAQDQPDHTAKHPELMKCTRQTAHVFVPIFAMNLYAWWTTDRTAAVGDNEPSPDRQCGA